MGLLLALAGAWLAPQAHAADVAAVEEGREIAFDTKRGNCLSCHVIPGGQGPGSVAPALVAMKVRFPDRAVLREHVWDQTKFRPHAMMPPFGKHGILTEGEIDKVVEFLYTL